MATLPELVARLETAIDEYEALLAGDENATVSVQGGSKDSVTKRATDAATAAATSTATSVATSTATSQATSTATSVANSVAASAAMTEIENQFASLQTMIQGRQSFSTKALMDADLDYAADTLAEVWNDPTEDNNGLYGKVGASGTGSWSKSPYSSGSAATAGVSARVDSLETSMEVLFPKKASVLLRGDSMAAGTASEGIWDVRPSSVDVITDTYLNGLGITEGMQSTTDNYRTIDETFSADVALAVRTAIQQNDTLLTFFLHTPDGQSAQADLAAASTINIPYFYQNRPSPSPKLQAHGYIQVDTNNRLYWFHVAAQPDMLLTDTSRPLIYSNMINVTGSYICGFNIFEFEAGETVDINACAWDTFPQTTGGSPTADDLFAALDRVDLLERQNKALKKFTQGKGLTKAGLNMSPASYFSTMYPYIDLMKSAHASYSDNTWEDSNGWISQLPDGQSIEKYVVIHNEQWIPEGDYVITWTGNATVTAKASAAISNVVTAANRVTFTLSDAAFAINTHLVLTISNSSGSPVDVTDIRVFKAELEADLDGGAIFAPHMDEYWARCQVFRFMDWLRTNNSDVTDFADFATEAHCTYTGAGGVPGWVPPSICAKLAKKYSAEVWINIPHLATNACVQAMADAIYAAYPECPMIHVEYSNEIWNSGTFTQFNEIIAAYASTYSATGSTVDQVNKIQGARSLEIWDIFDAKFGRTKVRHVMGTQLGNFSAYTPVFDVVWNSRTVGDEIDAYAVAPYASITGGQGIATGTSELELSEQKAYNNAESFWQQGVENSVAVAKTRLTNLRNWLDTNWPRCEMTAYEGGQHLQVTDYLEDYEFTIDTGNNWLTYTGGSLDGLFEDGEEIGHAYYTEQSIFSGQSSTHHQGFLVRRQGTDSLKVYLNQGDYDSDTPAVLDNTLGATAMCGNVTRRNGMTQLYYDMNVGNTYPAVMQTAVSGVMEAARGVGVETFCYYSDVGNWSDLTSMFVGFWGADQYPGAGGVKWTYFKNLIDDEGKVLPTYIPEV